MFKKIVLISLVLAILTASFYWQHLRDLEHERLKEQHPFVKFSEKVESQPIRGKLIISVTPPKNERATIMRIILNTEKQERNRSKIERLLTLLNLSEIYLETNDIAAYQNAFLNIMIKHKKTIFNLPVSEKNYKENIQLKNFFKLFQIYANELQETAKQNKKIQQKTN